MPSIPESNNFPACFHRVTIKGLVVKDSKILLVKESSKLSGKWELPGGGLDFGEDIHQALRREVEEEMGLKIKSIEKRPMYVWPWRYENKRGIDWYYSLVVAYRIELENLDFKTTDECEEVRFFSKEELSGIDLCHQAKGLLDIFDPKDFG